jgi:Putative auto-transporter adhesin, head GIN domain
MFKRQKLSHILFYSFFGCVLLISSCEKGPDFLKKYGTEGTELRQLTGVNELTVGEKFKVLITQDTSVSESITIYYASNLLSGIGSEVKNGVLNIEDNNNFNWVRDLDVRPICKLNVHKLDKITAKGACTIECLDTLTHGLNFSLEGVGSHKILIRADQLSGKCMDAGKVTFIGWGGLFLWSCENGGTVDAQNMGCADAYLDNFTDRDVSINPKMVLVTNIYGKGNVFYYSEPSLKLKKEEYGIGRLIKK